jgi:outer membrane protein assembly factor BamB
MYCGGYGENQKVQKIDPATGDTIWSYNVPEGAKNIAVLSTEPVVLALGLGKHAETDIFALDDKGQIRSKLSLGTETLGPRYDPNCRSSNGAGWCATVVVEGDTMYLPSREHQGKADYGRTNEVVAFDLATGKPVKKYDAGEKRTMVPMRMDGDTLISYRKPTYDSGGQVVGIDLKSGKQEVWLRMPNDTADKESAMSLDSVPYLFEGGRFFMSTDIVSGRSSGSDDRELAMAFGSE